MSLTTRVKKIEDIVKSKPIDDVPRAEKIRVINHYFGKMGVRLGFLRNEGDYDLLTDEQREFILEKIVNSTKH